jgi:eight-cysteine-cluster-containing protein
MALLLLLMACAKTPDTPTEAPAPADTPAAEAAAPTAPLILGEADAAGQPTEIVLPAGGSPADLYGACKERVEGTEKAGTEKAGECTTDADCGKAGCSGEVCVAKSQVANVITTCDVQPCFAVLDTCGCAAGLCTWTLKSSP